MECSVSEYWYNKAEEKWTFYFKGEIGLTPDLRRRASNSENTKYGHWSRYLQDNTVVCKLISALSQICQSLNNSFNYELWASLFPAIL